MASAGLLLLNLGSPRSTDVGDVRAYLRQFLMDPRVIDIPSWRRWLIVHCSILPFRPKTTAEAYRTIWSDRGSPLIATGRELTEKVQRILGDGVLVRLGMRYGEPALRSALDEFRAAGIDRIVAFPLYPQYASATTGSSIEALFAQVNQRWNTPFLQIVPPFYDHPAFVEAFAAGARSVLAHEEVERVLFSFHGLPERHVRKADQSQGHCLAQEDCCGRIKPINRNCYRAQCYATAEKLGDAIGIPEEKRVVCFQSRLGRTPWIRPYTDLMLEELPKAGIRHIALLSPAFVSDCLETLEELHIRAREQWRRAGGETFHLPPSGCLRFHRPDPARPGRYRRPQLPQ